MDQSSTVHCKNCGHTYSGHYCPMCAQPKETHPLTWHELFHIVFHALFHADKGILYTTKELFLHPGTTLRDYVNGKRIHHFNPFLFLLLIGGLTTFTYHFFHIPLPNEELNLALIEHLNKTLAHKYFVSVGVLFIVLLTLTDFIWYRKNAYTLPELFVSNCFQAGQIMVITLLCAPLLLVEHIYGDNFLSHYVLKIGTLCFLFMTRVSFFQLEGRKDYIKLIVQLIIVYLLQYFLLAQWLKEWL